MIIHVVQSGETISSIAELYNLPADKLILENGILNPNNLVVGQTIVIIYPLLEHTVQVGDTLESIADMYQVSVMHLLRNNPYLSNQTYLYPGENITINYDTDKIGSMSVGGYVYSYVNEDTLRKTLPFLTFLAVFDYQVNDRGDITEVDDQWIVNMAKEYHVFPMMFVSTLSGQGIGSREITHMILNNPDVQDRMIDNLLANMDAKGYYGLNQYFEFLDCETLKQVESLIIKTGTRLKNEGLRYTITITTKLNVDRTQVTYDAIDFSTISQYVDAIILLSYDWGYSFEPPASAAPINIRTAELNQVTKTVDPEKFVLGLPVIGYDWRLPYVPGYTVANSITYDTAIQIASDMGVPIQFNEIAAAPYFFYYGIEGSLHNVWFKDARSIDKLTRLVPEFGLQGTSIWNNMYFFTQMWFVINNLYDINKVLV